jgi:hypothetical protein
VQKVIAIYIQSQVYLFILNYNPLELLSSY